MTTKEMVAEIERCTEILIHNQTEEGRWNDKMLEPTDCVEFEAVVKARSQAIREFYRENEECIAILSDYARNIPEHEVALALYETIRTMLIQGRMDPGLMFSIASPLEQYLREKEGETERAIIISMIRVSCAADYYLRMMHDFHAEDLMDSSRWIISKQDSYVSLEREAARVNIFNAYNALVALNMGRYTEEAYLQNLQTFKQALALWNSPEVQALDGENQDFFEAISNLSLWDPLELASTAIEYPEIASAALEMCMKECAQYEKSDNWLERCIYDLVVLFDSKNKNELPDAMFTIEMLALLKRIPDPMWESDMVYSQVVLQGYVIILTILLQVLSKMKLSPAARESIVNDVWNDSRRILKDIPYRYQTAYVNGLFKSIFERILPNVSNGAFVEHLIDELLIRRQPATYFHSYMVEKIAQLIAEEMLDKAPELFLTLPGYDAVAAVQDAREDIIATIGRGARLHDVGKCAVASVIMLQSRKLFDDEFLCIKGHPELGFRFLEKYGEYKACLDIIRGHHKTYDGKKGYPESFDNTTSPYRLLIDLISISDSIDAATDTLGRNYTAGKDFRCVLAELKEGAGTRYNPDIVAVIEKTPELIDKLTLLTGRDRIEQCYEIYSQIVK